MYDFALLISPCFAASDGSRSRQCNGERVTAQRDQSDKPPDCGLAVDVGAHKLSPSGSAWPSALDLMRKRPADAASP
jgi:hypothetical protein